MAQDVWVLAEHWRGQVAEITYELLALGGELASALETRLVAVLLGQGVSSLAGNLGKAEVVLYGEHERLAEPAPETVAEALAGLAAERKPRVILVPLTNVSLGIGSLAGCRLKAPSINFCNDAVVKDGRLEAHCLLYGGKVEAAVTMAGEPAILGVWPGSRPPESGQSAASPAVETVPVTLSAAPAARFKRYIEPEGTDIDISQQEVLIGVGRGIQTKENMELAEELAQALGGVVCGSRPVIDQGWLPLSRQVGKSGQAIKPKLYVAVGISGAPEHVEGIRGSETIVAVNTDPAAPIFHAAHWGVVGDAMDVLPELTAAVQAAKG